MEENEKDFAKYEKSIQEIIEKVNIAILNGKKDVTIEDGKSIIFINILENSDEKEKYDIEFGGEKIASVKKGEKVPSDVVRRRLENYKNMFDIQKMNVKLGRNPTEQEKSNPKSLTLESELKQAIEEGRAEKLRMGREITAAGEDLSLLTKRMFGERAKEVYRIRDKKDAHTYKYIGIGNDGSYFEPRGSRTNEGTNSRQKCWIQNTDGTFVKKTVDDMKVFGKYVIATDIADNVATDNTKTLIGQRTPRGEYILMPALDHRIADTSNNINVKDNLARGNSIWEIEDVILAAKLGDTLRGTKLDGKLSADEVEFIRKLKKEGLRDEKVKKIVDAVLIVGELKDQELNDISIKALLNTVDKTAERIEELKKEGFNDKEIKQVMESVYKENEMFESAKKEILKERESEGEEKVRGEVPEGPWSNSRH